MVLTIFHLFQQLIVALIFVILSYLGDPRCPVASFKKYMDKLHPENDNFWQRPKKSITSNQPGPWFDNSPIGKNMLYSFMARMCVEAKLNTRYTNHSVRATSITALDHAGIDSRHIMAISGHKSEQSIKSYSQNVSDTKKREMADVLSTNTTVLNPAKGANSTVSKVQTETLPPSDMGLTGHAFERSDKQDVHMEHGLLPGSVDKSSNVPSFTFANCQVTLNFNRDMKN